MHWSPIAFLGRIFEHPNFVVLGQDFQMLHSVLHGVLTQQDSRKQQTNTAREHDSPVHIDPLSFVAKSRYSLPTISPTDREPSWPLAHRLSLPSRSTSRTCGSLNSGSRPAQRRVGIVMHTITSSYRFSTASCSSKSPAGRRASPNCSRTSPTPGRRGSSTTSSTPIPSNMLSSRWNSCADCRSNQLVGFETFEFTRVAFVAHSAAAVVLLDGLDPPFDLRHVPERFVGSAGHGPLLDLLHLRGHGRAVRVRLGALRDGLSGFQIGGPTSFGLDLECVVLARRNLDRLEAHDRVFDAPVLRPEVFVGMRFRVLEFPCLSDRQREG